MNKSVVLSKMAIIKGICNGIIQAVIINIWVIMSFYVNYGKSAFYFMGLPLAVAAWLLLKQSKIKVFFFALIFSILGYILTTIGLSALGIVNCFYQNAVDDGIRMTAGDGFGIMLIHAFNYLWAIVGTVFVFIKTCLVQRNEKKLKFEKATEKDFLRNQDSIEETLTFPYAHWSKIGSNNVIERLNREIRHRTRVVGTFPDGNSALMLVCARLRHVAGTSWGTKRYMDMKHLEITGSDESDFIAG